MKNIKPITSISQAIPSSLERKRRPRFIRTMVMVGATTLIFIAVALVHPDRAESQPPPPPSKPAQTPIDGGLGLLAAAGGAYAVKKLRDREKG